MPYRVTPQDMVPMLIKSLEKTNLTQYQDDFNNIKNKLTKIQHYFPLFKGLEEDLMYEFKKLGQEIDDDVFQQMEPREGWKKNLNSIQSCLESITKIMEMNKISKGSGERRNLMAKALRQDSITAVSQDKSWTGSTDDWIRLKVEQKILCSQAMASLKVSYDNLEYQERLCLLCCSVFPENSVIRKRPLVYWWIGEGFVTNKKNTAEEMGEEIFSKLIEKGMILAVNKGQHPVVSSCKLDPWVRRMLISVAKEAEFFDFDEMGKIKYEFLKSYRACLVLGDNEFASGPAPKEEKKFEKLSTLFNVDKQFLNLPPTWLSELKRLRVLMLGRWQSSSEHHIEVEMPDNDAGALNSLGALKQLKYLSLQGISRINKLPASFLKLVNLEVLDLRACHNLEELPPGIGSLKKLTHVDVSECYFLEGMPNGLRKIPSLQVLKGFVLGTAKKDFCKLRDLAQLPKLRKLGLYVRNKAYIEESEPDALKKLDNLRVLTITWGGVVSSLQKEKTKQAELLRSATSITMKFFSLPTKLEKLDLRCWANKESPKWLRPENLKELKRLYIRGGEFEKFVGGSDEKWKVGILRLKYLKNMKVVQEALSIDFPDLVYLEEVEAASGIRNEWKWTKDGKVVPSVTKPLPQARDQ